MCPHVAHLPTYAHISHLDPIWVPYGRAGWEAAGKSLFMLWIADPRSSVRPSLTRAWWLSATGYVAVLEPHPGEVAASGLGASPGIAPGLASQKATAWSPGRQPFWPTQSHLLHSMALQWSERAERALSTPNPKKKIRRPGSAPADRCRPGRSRDAIDVGVATLVRRPGDAPVLQFHRKDIDPDAVKTL